MTTLKLLDRLTSPYKNGKKAVKLATLKTNAGSGLFYPGFNLYDGLDDQGDPINPTPSPYLIEVSKNTGDTNFNVEVTYLKTDLSTDTETIIIPAETRKREVVISDLINEPENQKEILGIVSASVISTSPSGIELIFWSLTGNIAKLLYLAGEQTSEFLRYLKTDVLDQRFLSQAFDYGLDLHGADVGVSRLGTADEVYRGKILLAKTFGRGTIPIISDLLIEFADLSVPPVFIEWWNGQWILDQSSLPNELIIGGLQGIGTHMAEVHISILDSSKTLDELQEFVNSVTPVTSYVRVVLKYVLGFGISFIDTFESGDLSEYINNSGFSIITI